MNKFAVAAIAFIAVVAGLAVLYPEHTQRALFTGALKTNVLLLKYWYKVSNTEQSFESMALERLLRLTANNDLNVGVSRQGLEAYGKLFEWPAGVTVEGVNISRNDGTQLPAYWIIPAENNNKTAILYLHGGAFICGSFGSHGRAVAEIARRVGSRVLFIEYRLAPEHPFPALIEDALTAYKWLVFDQKFAANRTAVIGDSAGGGLTLLTLLALQDEAKGTIPSPAAAVTFSAWTDLSTERPSYEKNAALDVLLKETQLAWAAGLATNTRPEDRAARKSHKFSPIFAPSDKLAKLPPLYMTVGDSEILHDDTAHFAGKALQAGCDIKLVVAPRMQHVYEFFFPYIPEANQELNHIAVWVKRQLRLK